MNKIPKGFRVSGVASGIKSTDTEDIALIICDSATVAAGVYTKNQVVAAPVVLDRQRTPSDSIRAIVVNSGNANACTGELGMTNAIRMCELTAEKVACAGESVLVMSTGIIGEQLPMDCVEKGIASAAESVGVTDAHLDQAARGILTTDTKTKIATKENGHVITGIAKGSGMIGPRLAGPPSATMLATVLTDAALSPQDAQRILEDISERSFNAINVDGHTSTNDTLLLLASGDGEPLNGASLEAFAADLEEVCVSLAKQIVDDGEGATHLIEISVTGAESNSDARVIAEAIANSPLVKTAIAGNDPNWGRIVSAAGYAGPPIQVDHTTLTLNGTPIYRNGQPLGFDAEESSKKMAAERNVFIEITVGQGSGAAKFWTCDLTHGYVTINAEYHT